MKVLIGIFLWVLTADPMLEKMRKEYALIGVNQEHVENLRTLCSHQSGPLSEAYAAGAEMASAQYLNNPIQKLSAFNSGKNKLERVLSVPENASSPEIRFVRYSGQLKCPAILGYTKNMKEDKAFLLKALPKLKKSEAPLYTYILGFLLLHDSLSKEEKQALAL